MDLITVGDVMVDVRVESGALARGGDVHGRVLLQPGGTSANAAVWASSEGASSQVIGRIGRDFSGLLMDSALQERGVDRLLVEDPDLPTGTMLVMHEAGERSMVADRGANARLAPDDLPERLEAGALLISGYLLLQKEGHDTALAALRRADAEWVAVEAASWPLIETFGAERFLEETSKATVVLANDLEAEALTGSTGEEAAKILGEHYRLAAVKRGSRGAVLVVDGQVFSLATQAVEEIDPTGAGDAFDGVLLACLVEGASPEEALARACRAGASVAGSESAWPAMPR